MREQVAHDLYLLGEEATHDTWAGSPEGPDETLCPLCEQQVGEGPRISWYADDLYLGHPYCVKRALAYGTPPGQSTRFGEAGAVMRVYESVR